MPVSGIRYTFTSCAQVADDGGKAWTDAENAATSDNARASVGVNQGEAARTLRLTVAGPLTKPAVASGLAEISAVVEGYTLAGVAYAVGVQRLRLRDGSAQVGDEETPDPADAALGGVEGEVDTLDAQGDPLFGMSAAAAEAWTQGGTVELEVQVGAAAGFSASPIPATYVDSVSLRIGWEFPDPSVVGIDAAAVERMVQQAVQNAAGDVAVVFAGMPDPDKPSGAWVRLIAVDLVYEGSTRGVPDSESDVAEVVVALEVVVPASVTRERSNALGAACAQLRHGLRHRTLDDPTGHRLVLRDAEVRQDRPTGREPAQRSAGVTLSAYVERTSGATLE